MHARPSQRLFHGGAPRIRINGLLLPADRLGLRVDYSSPAFAAGSIAYDPSKVYVTTDVGVATGYAARYVDPATGLVGGGWVYEVATTEPPVSDPDFWTFPDAYLMANKARVLRVVKRNVRLSRPEQARLEHPYLAWDADLPMYDESGFMQPSPQMQTEGVTAPMLRSYGRWLPVKVVDGQGKFVPSLDARRGTIPLIEDMYARIPALTSPPEHPIQRDAPGRLSCRACQEPQPDVAAAARHQLSEDLCRMLELGTGPKGLPVLIRELAKHGASVLPEHWAWFTASADPATGNASTR